jgi:hypothetical protein
VVSPLDGGGTPSVDDAGQGSDDAGPPLGLEHFVDGWKLASWAPGCGLYEPATDAGWAEIPPLTWTACLSGRPGCQQLTFTTAYTGKNPLSTLQSVSALNGDVTFGLVRSYTANYDDWLVWSASRGLVSAWRTAGDNHCDPQLGTVAQQMAMTAAIDPNPSGGADDISSWFQIVGAPDQLMGRAKADYAMDGNAIGIPGAAYFPVGTSGSLMTFYYGPTHVLDVRDRGTNTFARVSKADGGALHVGSPTWLAGDSVIFDAYTSPASIGAWSAATKYRTLVAPAPGAQSHSVSTDGTWVVWEDSYDADLVNGSYTMATLYVAPFPKGTDPLVPKSLGTVPCSSLYCDVTVSDGHVYAGSGGADATIVRISDGARWAFAPMPTSATKDRFGGYGIIFGGELWISSELSGIERIQLSALPQK